MSDADILARTLYGEARGDGVEGMEAVACVIMNRYKAHKWFTGYEIKDGKKVPSVAATCQQKFQFSCWNRNDVNFHKICNVTTKDLAFCQCLEVAERAISGKLTDFTNGATHYHTKQIKPVWAKGKAPCYEVKNHLFYNDI